MRLHTIRITDYRAHAHTVVNFCDFSAAAIVGENGAGKSTLLDALLWCMYGQSRSASADGVVRLGTEAASVRVEFAGVGGDFAVLRKRSVKGRGKTEVDLYRIDDGAVTPLTGKTIADTQAAINDALGVDHDTLVSASVIRQGDSNRFSRATPEERRGILRSILRIERWRDWARECRALAEAARRDAERARAGAPDLGVANANYEIALESLATTRAAEATAQLERNRTEHALEEARGRLAAARAEVDAAQRAHAQRGRLEAEVARGRSVVADAQAALDLRGANARRLRRESADARGAVDAARAAAEEAERHLAEATTADARRAELKRDKDDLAVKWRAKSAEAGGMDGMLERIARAEAAAADLPAAIEAREVAQAALDVARSAHAAASSAASTVDETPGVRAAIAERDRVVDAAEEARAAAAEALAASRSAEHKLAAAKALVATRAADVERAKFAAFVVEARAARLAQAPCAGGPWTSSGAPSAPYDMAGTCPLLADARDAAAGVPAARAEAERAASDLEAAQASQRLLQAVDEVCNADSHAAGLKADAANISASSARKDVDGARADAMKVVLAAIAAANADISAADAALDAARRREATATSATADVETLRSAAESARTARADLDRIRVEGENLAADLARIAVVDVDGLQSSARVRRDAVTTLDVIIAREADADAETTWCAGPGASALQAANAALNDATVALAACVTPDVAEGALRDAEAAASEANRVAAAATTSWRVAAERVAVDQTALANAERMVAAANEGEAAAAEHDAKAREWAAAERAFAAAAVHLIETAIPALEARANDVLGRISSRGMVLRLETQRVLKSGDGMAETLDIIVRDDVGERPYEDFSGGEQFRIDLALRLGLAQLLADRDGVPVEALIIDEGGLGALDPAGLAAVKETLAGLQAMYPLLLVVSHLPDVSDCLPTRLTVVPGPDGSRVVIDGALACDREAA